MKIKNMTETNHRIVKVTIAGLPFGVFVKPRFVEGRLAVYAHDYVNAIDVCTLEKTHLLYDEYFDAYCNDVKDGNRIQGFMTGHHDEGIYVDTQSEMRLVGYLKLDPFIDYYFEATSDLQFEDINPESNSYGWALASGLFYHFELGDWELLAQYM